MPMRRWLGLALVLGVWVVLIAAPQPVSAYIGGPPASLGMMCHWSTHVITVKVEKVDKEKGVIVWRKISETKGKWPAEVIRQVVPAGLPERQQIFGWAEVGRTTAMFALESYRWGHTYIDGLWYASNTADWQWWNVSHGEPIVLRTFSGKPDRLIGACNAILAGKEVVVPCLMDAPPEELRLRKAKVQRLKASLKLLDYNPKRDFAALGGDDFSRIGGMPGFTHSSPVGRVDTEAQAISAVDFDGDGKLDLCLAGAGRIALLQNGGDFWSELPLATAPVAPPAPQQPERPTQLGGRAAVWADYNGDGRPDLLLATPSGPKLFTNLGSGAFRDDSECLPKEPSYNLTAACWIDYDSDGRPDLLLANGFHGLRLYRNQVKPNPYFALVNPNQAPPPPTAPAFEDVSDKAGLGEDGAGGNAKGDTLTVCDVNGDGRPDVLYGAGTGLLLLNTKAGFVEAKDSGISYKSGKVGPVFGDFNNDGFPDLVCPQLDGACRLFQNDGKGRFTEVTGRSGDLAKPAGIATCAAWGDIDNDGQLDLVIGCLKGPNRFFRNLGDGKFADATEAIGLEHRIYNTQAIALVDLNNDGQLDLVCNNEGQESLVLLGDPAFGAKRTPVMLTVTGPLGVVGSSVRVLDRAGKCLGSEFICGGDGRGGQRPPSARFALQPGGYRVEVRFSSGLVQARNILVEATPLRATLDDRMPRVE
jgi:hypothetical protein